MKIKLIKVVMTSVLIILSLASILTVDATLENINVNSQIQKFMDNGKEVATHGRFTFYEVIIEEELRTPSIEFTSSGNPYVSTPGDIFVLRESLFTYLPMAAEFITFYFGGHAGIVYDEDTIIETTGMEVVSDQNKVITYRNNILFRPEKVETVGLRVKASDDEVKKAVDFSYNTVDSLYNYSFIFGRKDKFYCTDLISRSFGQEAGLDFKLDEDGIAVSCNDLIVSDDTFITYYMRYEGYDKHLYYAVNK